MAKKGLFCVFEGADGVGKTTIVKELKTTLDKYFSSQDIVITTREPGGSVIGEQIRNILNTNEIDHLTEAYLFAANRIDHINNVIKKAIAQNKIVLCDRFVYSSLVYQGVIKGLGIDLIKQLNSYAFDNLPDLVFYFDLDTKTIAQRKLDQNNKLLKQNERLEKEFGLEAKIDLAKKTYLQILDLNAKNTFLIDNKKPIDEVVNEIKQIITSHYGLK